MRRTSHAILVVLSLVFTLCLIHLALKPNVPLSYVFQNPPEEIVAIELLYNESKSGEGTDPANIQLIRSLEKEEIPIFMESVYSLETERFTPPLYGWGCYIARVTYSNGDIEMLGSLNIEFIENGATPTGIGSYYFVGEEYTSIFTLYIDTSTYPRID